MSLPVISHIRKLLPESPLHTETLGGDPRGDGHLRKDFEPHHPEAEGKRHGGDRQGEGDHGQGAAGDGTGICSGRE